ncbi:N-acetylmuramoyl-L-alanine amidase [Anaerovirgula multivorans]|uniref:N-acetylmuramoyl-L-alanine amidase n=1 Tax=Anaerovirgula multivorans TaxID=312168 RepID=A0A239B973_9FIRM|nr:cell wall hydrolase [Anaerovirgula multivorans]SNS03653.1 N-acetylmuramoyl-L-alanine amidase [Anaerovirgula multivorans]
MKIQSRKITTGLLVLAFMVMIVASIQIASAPNTDIEGIVTGIEEDLTDHEEIAEEEATEEEIEKEEKYLREKVQENALLSTSDDSETEKSIVTGANKNNNAVPIVDMSPITGERYTVKNGDTLFLIAQRANTTINELISMNSLKNDMIQVGQVIQTKKASQVSNIASSDTNQSVSRGSQRDDDIYWLSRIIHAEAQGESYQGKIAVGNVILNRVRSGNFPNSIYGVVFDKQNGYTQFSPVIDGTIYNTPGKDSVQAATEVLNGARPVGEALYFLNPRKATNFWIVANRKYMQTIGDHDFYY